MSRGSSSNGVPPGAVTLAPLSPGRLFVRFLRFGFMAWGGPVAQIAMLRTELVDEERWIESGRFNRLLAVYQVLPGPEAHELCVHLGMLRGGRLGGVMAGLGFMLPGLVLMLALSWLYFRIDITRSALGPVFLGVQVAVIALIVRAVHRIGAHVLVDRWLWGLAAAGAVASFLGASFWLVLPAAGLVHALAASGSRIAAVTTALAAAFFLAILVLPIDPDALLMTEGPAPVGGPAAVQAAPLVLVFVSGLKAGLLTFGGAYTAIPFLRDDAVGRGWMSDAQFLDGLALSGVLPAPLIIFSTFVGYSAGGPPGALAMTASVFLPAFAFSLLLHERLEAVVGNNTLRSFLEGVSAGVVGLIAATTVELGAQVWGRLPAPLAGLAIFAAALAVLYLWKAKTNMIAVVAGAGLTGWTAFGPMLR